jgi:hypothetical protein
MYRVCGAVLIPPKERRAVIDKLAEFVKRNGQQFEDKVRIGTRLRTTDKHTRRWRALIQRLKNQREKESKGETRADGGACHILDHLIRSRLHFPCGFSHL